MLLHALNTTKAHQRVMEECFRQGTPLPDSLQHAPTLNRGLHLYYDAFWQLHTCRQIGEVEGPISWAVIDSWCQRHGLDGEAAHELHYHVERLDAVYLEHRRAALEKAREDSKRRQRTAAKPAARRSRQ